MNIVNFSVIKNKKIITYLRATCELIHKFSEGQKTLMKDTSSNIRVSCPYLKCIVRVIHRQNCIHTNFLPE